MKSALRLVTACLLVCLAVPQSLQAGGDMGGESPYEIGEKLVARKNHKTALKYFQKALSRNDPRAHYGMGLIHEAAGEDAEALSQYQRFIGLALPDDALRGDAIQRIGAIEGRQKTIAAKANELLERGKSLFKAGKYREAEKVLRQAASQDDSEPEVHFFLGEVYLALEEYDKAKAEYNKAKRAY